jgi:hypothetical protein
LRLLAPQGGGPDPQLLSPGTVAEMLDALPVQGKAKDVKLLHVPEQVWFVASTNSKSTGTLYAANDVKFLSPFEPLDGPGFTAWNLATPGTAKVWCFCMADAQQPTEIDDEELRRALVYWFRKTTNGNTIVALGERAIVAHDTSGNTYFSAPPTDEHLGDRFYNLNEESLEHLREPHERRLAEIAHGVNGLKQAKKIAVGDVQGSCRVQHGNTTWELSNMGNYRKLVVTSRVLINKDGIRDEMTLRVPHVKPEHIDTKDRALVHRFGSGKENQPGIMSKTSPNTSQTPQQTVQLVLTKLDIPEDVPQCIVRDKGMGINACFPVNIGCRVVLWNIVGKNVVYWTNIIRLGQHREYGEDPVPALVDAGKRLGVARETIVMAENSRGFICLSQIKDHTQFQMIATTVLEGDKRVVFYEFAEDLGLKGVPEKTCQYLQVPVNLPFHVTRGDREIARQEVGASLLFVPRNVDDAILGQLSQFGVYLCNDPVTTTWLIPAANAKKIGFRPAYPGMGGSIQGGMDGPPPYTPPTIKLCLTWLQQELDNARNTGTHDKTVRELKRKIKDVKREGSRKIQRTIRALNEGLDASVNTLKHERERLYEELAEGALSGAQRKTRRSAIKELDTKISILDDEATKQKERVAEHGDQLQDDFEQQHDMLQNCVAHSGPGQSERSERQQAAPLA